MKANKRVLVVFVIVAALFSLLRIWISAGANYVFVMEAIYDDSLQLGQAARLAEFHWLGDYSQYTLIKSLSYPLFAAMFNFLHIPLGVGYGLLALLCALVFFLAFRGFIRPVMLFVGYLWVLFSPIGFQGGTSLRLYRNSITPQAVIIFVFLAIGLYLRARERSFKGLLPWDILVGLSFAFFWNLREDSIWLLPFFVGYSGFLAFRLIKNKKNIVKTAALVLIPVLVLLGINTGIAGMNYIHYGVFTGNDRTSGPFADTMRLLYEMEVRDNDNPDIWLPRANVMKACDVSKSLGSMRREINDAWDFWVWDEERDGTEVRGDLVQWALRDAASNAGHFQNAVETQDFFNRVAEELRAAYERGEIAKGPGVVLSPQAKRFTLGEMLAAIPDTFAHGAEFINQSFSGGRYPLYSEADEARIAFGEELTGLKALRKGETDGQMELISRISDVYMMIYRVISWVVTVVTFLAWCYVLVGIIRRKIAGTLREAWLITTGIGLNAFAGIYIVVLFSGFLPIENAISFYAVGVYALMQVCNMAGVYYLVETLMVRKGRWEPALTIESPRQNEPGTGGFSREFFLYLVVGGTATLVEWAAFYVLNRVLGLHYAPGTALAFVLSTLANWGMGRLLLFKKQGSLLKELSQIYLVSIVGLLFNLALMYLAIDILGFSEMISKMAATVIVFFWNFIMRKKVVYR